MRCDPHALTSVTATSNQAWPHAAERRARRHPTELIAIFTTETGLAAHQIQNQAHRQDPQGYPCRRCHVLSCFKRLGRTRDISLPRRDQSTRRITRETGTAPAEKRA